jgi:hypothetical protein
MRGFLTHALTETNAKSASLKDNAAMLLIFVYFLTLSADLIKLDILQFSLKLCHLVASGLCFFIFCSKRSFCIERRLTYCFLLILSSLVTSSLLSVNIGISLTYCIIYVFSFVVFFIIPLNLMYFGDEKKLLKLYCGSFFLIGAYAALQFFFSMFDIILPFTTQQVVFVRGSGFSLEPSFYALYAIPIVMFLNVYMIIERKPTWKKLTALLFANLFLLVSTSTTALVSYLVCFFTILFFSFYPPFRPFFKGVKRLLFKYTLIFGGLLCLAGYALSDMFKDTVFKFFANDAMKLDSFNDRWFGITNAFQVFCEYPLFGVGLGNVGPRIYKELLSEDQPYLISYYDRFEIQRFEPTNVMTEVLSSLGTYGFLGFAVLMVVLWSFFRKILAEPKLELHERNQILSLLISSIVMLVCLQINQGLFRSYIWVHIALSIGYILKIRERLNRCAC